MNTIRTDEMQGSESASLSLSAMEDLPMTESTGEPAAAEAGAGPPPGSFRTRVVRVLILTAVGLATGALLVTGATWLLYRAAHTVISHATVKGNVARIGARIDGQVKQLDVQPGQRVAKGDVLIRLEDEHLRAALRVAQAELNAAAKRFDAEKLDIEFARRRLPLELERSESVRKASESEVQAAESNQQKLEHEFDRVQSLIKAGISSAKEMDQAQADRDHGRAVVRAARGNLAAAESNCQLAKVQLDGLRVREAGLDVMAAEVERARQHVSSVEADLAATVIRAPADGWVAERIIEPGGSAKVGEPILSLWTGTPWIEAWADEKNLTRISIGSQVDVTFAAYPGHKVQGRVEAIGVLADQELHAGPVPSTLHSLFPENAMVPIRVAVAADQIRLQPGLTALVGIADENAGPSVQVAGWLDNILASILRSSPAANK